MVESGFTGFDVRLWVGVFARAGVPENRIRVIEREVVRWKGVAATLKK